MRYRYRTEKLQLQTLMRLDLSGATVLDIGANKGIYCFWMSRAVGRLGRVIAFEPQPEMNVAISRLKSIFKWRNMRVLNVALSSVDGVAVLARQRVGDGSASLQPSRRNVANETLMVATTKLDTIDMDFSNLRFIKCDVEGHEHDVFRGAEHTIRRYRPVVQFEATPSEAQGVFDFFIGLGYFGVMMLGNRYLNYLSREAHYKFGNGGHRDFLFFPPEAIGTTIGPNIYNQFPEEASRRG
ncbi:methyltransferase FkbM [Nitrobacter sp. Nb-311A]|uniref:FkbM family methyltransferase n=2 Tax=unclassified Nitrobacter TaxID=2620411 RepID=UPI0000685E0B|nr:FkbM family methyltransferase [Nitrobacter sp. Nb-311A]EAQ35210.1 methyltransferase FkbM [Nitrobacter sp. Nb-311A]MCB1393971.1 FkbM family methyltransferase [Nitrobacter sp.]MCV0386557.1 FkbM family methyltransferase [Nitrobacter sp.]